MTRFSHNMLPDVYIIFQNKSASTFEIAHKTCSMLVWVTVPPYTKSHYHFLKTLCPLNGSKNCKWFQIIQSYVATPWGQHTHGSNSNGQAIQIMQSHWWRCCTITHFDYTPKCWLSLIQLQWPKGRGFVRVRNSFHCRQNVVPEVFNHDLVLYCAIW